MDDQLLQKRNRFGLLAQDYVKHRRGYPSEVYEEVRKRLPGRLIDALDVGCGTGVVTYELAKFCHSVIGTDKEAEMIELAQAGAPDNCKFNVAPAESLPFPDSSFDLITVAQAFHWFDHDKVIDEFRRLIRPNGLIVVFRKKGKEDNKILADFVWPVVNRYIELPHLPRVQNDFSKLKEAGFASCEIVNVPYEELYTPDEYIGFLRSHSSYNLIPEVRREQYLQAMRVEMARHLEEGFVAIRGIVEMWFLVG